MLEATFITVGYVQIISSILGLGCFIILTPIMWVRRLQKLAIFHIFGDIMVFLVTISVVSFSLYYWASHGTIGPDVTAFNKNYFALYFGTLDLINCCNRECNICFLRRWHHNTHLRNNVKPQKFRKNSLDCYNCNVVHSLNNGNNPLLRIW